jgi:hypothetical protein
MMTLAQAARMLDAVAPGDTIRARTAKGAIVATVTAREP